MHFDEHGTAVGEDALVFERPGGGADYLTVGRLACVLTAADVSVAVCQSGAIGKRLETAIATGLLSGGVNAVVAMSYRVYAVAAAEFMTAFYDQLLAGGTISEAVREGRSRRAHSRLICAASRSIRNLGAQPLRRAEPNAVVFGRVTGNAPAVAWRGRGGRCGWRGRRRRVGRRPRVR